MPSPPRRSARRACWALAVLIAGATGRGRAEEGWEVGRAVPIEVTGGSARFAVPTGGPGGKSLVIVSALAREPGPFPVRIAARPAVAAGRPRLADDGPRRDPTPGPAPGELRKTPEPGMPPGRRAFHLMVREGDVAVSANYREVAGRLRAVGRHVQVYVDEADAAHVGDEVLREIVATFDERVIPEVGRALGRAPDVDRDGRFSVLVTGWLARLAGGRLAVDGFVRGADLDPAMAAPFGNRCDMMYLSAAMGAGPHLRTVLAHEYAHAVVSGLKAFGGPGGSRSGPEEEGWLDEAIAHLVEDRLGFSRSNLDYRVAAFLAAPERYRLVVDDYYASSLFRSHGNRGSTYLFLRWCADRYGPGLIGRLARSEKLGIEALEGATGATFADLFRRWSVAMASPTTGSVVEGYASLDPAGAFGDWPLAGPRMSAVSPGGPADSWSAAGTSPHYALVRGGPAAAVEVEVSGPPGARLQVTAIRLPPGLPLLELSAVRRDEARSAPRALLAVRERDGAAVRLDCLSWEPLLPDPNPHATGFRRGSLSGPELASALGIAELPASGRLDARSLPLPPASRPDDGPIVLKLLGRDARGHRVAAWAELGPDPRLAGSPPAGTGR